MSSSEISSPRDPYGRPLAEEKSTSRIADTGPANATQHGGTHYKDQTIEPWDYALANKLGPLETNIVKYVTRYKQKGGIDDLRKAQHYPQKLIEVTLNGYPDNLPTGYFISQLRRNVSQETSEQE